MFRGRERDPSEVWSLVDFMCPFGLQLQRPFVIIRLKTFYLVGTHFFSWSVSVGLFFCMPLYYFIFFPMKVVAFIP